MGQYHYKLDKKYFKNSIYIKKFEEVFGIKIKDFPLQYELIYETYSTLIFANNTFFAKGYMKTTDRIKKVISNTNAYLDKYKNKIRKCYDSSCIDIYDELEIIVDELKEILVTYENSIKTNDTLKIKCKPILEKLEQFDYILRMTNFDCLLDNKKMPYKKMPNDKLPRKVNCKLIDGMEYRQNIMFDNQKQIDFNNKFIEKYYNRTKIDLHKDTKQREFIFTLHCIVKDINNAIVDYYIDNDITPLALFLDFLTQSFFAQDIGFVEDVEYRTLFEKLQEIFDVLWKKQIDIGYAKIKEIMNDYADLYEFMS